MSSGAASTSEGASPAPGFRSSRPQAWGDSGPFRPDEVIRALAATQHGVVARAQLVEAGLRPSLIDYRIRRGTLERLHRGIYRAGAVPGPREREVAAVLACGAAAVLSHRSAAVLWDLVPPGSPDEVVEVTVRGGFRAPGPSVRVHRTVDLPAEERAVVDGVPVTSPGRTVLDLAATATSRELESALARADREGLTTPEEVARLVDRHPFRAGLPVLRALLALEGRPALVRSEAESRFLALVRRGRLPAPEANVVVRGCEIDFLWRRARLAVEVDGYAFHSSARAFERDRRRDAVLAAAGLRVVRVTWRQITEEPEALLVRVTQALAWGGGAR